MSLICCAEKKWKMYQRSVTAWCNLVDIYSHEKGLLKIIIMGTKRGRERSDFSLMKRSKAKRKHSEKLEKDLKHRNCSRMQVKDSSLKDRSLLPPRLLYYLHKAALNKQKTQKSLKTRRFLSPQLDPFLCQSTVLELGPACNSQAAVREVSRST